MYMLLIFLKIIFKGEYSKEAYNLSFQDLKLRTYSSKFDK